MTSPSRVATSVITIGELELGLLMAGDPAARAIRGETLAIAREVDAVPVTASVMGQWARLVAACRAAGISGAVKRLDSLTGWRRRTRR